MRLSSSLALQFGLHLMLILCIVGQTNTSDELAENAENEYGSEDEEVATTEQTISAESKPAFIENHRTIYLKQENKTIISCNPKGFNSDRHSVLWFKDGNLIANGNHSMNKEFEVNRDMSLVINGKTRNMQGSFLCQINPGNVTQITILKISNVEDSDNGSCHQNHKWIVSLSLLSIIHSLCF